MKENKVITDIEQLIPERLTRIFKNKGYLNQGKVTKIIKKNSQESLSSNLHFLEINFSNNAHTKPVSPEIVVKIPKRSARFFGKHEAKFYSNIAETMDEMPIPTCYDAVHSNITLLSHIILQNLSDTYIELPGGSVPPSKHHCEKAIDCLAELHAFWWDHSKLKEFTRYAVVLGIMKENSFNEKEIFKWFKNQRRDLKQFFSIQKIPFIEGISDKRKEIFKTVFSLYPQLIYDRMSRKNITLIHSDAHFWNFFYPKDIDNEKLKACLTDWGTWGIGVGCQDLVFMIGIFLPPESRRLMEKDLIKRYYNNLLKFGIENYSWDECYYDYKLLAFLNLFRIIDWWRRNAPPKTWWPLFESCICTIEDLNCMELIESHD
ncbi:MAG: oxidoreductase family protein [Promethearchaeota archaeon]|jgi:hypothetical protein